MWAASSSEKLLPGAAARPAGAVALSAARGEFESFQVAVTGSATGVSATATALTGPGIIPAPRLYREALIDVANASALDGRTGRHPDALVPDVDDVVGVGEKRNAFPFAVPAGETRAIWAEVLVPRNAKPGTYTGSVTVRASGAADVSVPVTLTVWNFELPATSSLKSYYAISWGDLPAGHGTGYEAQTIAPLRARYAQLGLDHRISISGFDDGQASWDMDWFASHYGPLLDGTAPTQLVGAKLTSVEYLGKKTNASYKTWATFFRARGWFDRLFDYTCDEPAANVKVGSNELQCNWSEIASRAAVAKAADPEFRTLVTTNVDEASENGVLSAVDVLTPVVNYVDDKDGFGPHAGPQRAKYDSFLGGARKELWTYQSCMSHGCGGTVNFGNPSASDTYFTGWPSYMIDAASVRARSQEWLSFLWGTTGELYWETTYAYTQGDPWATQWDFNGNGDGTLFYPGTPGRIGGKTDIPVASIRLKMIRAGMQDYEYLKLLSDAGDPSLAKAIAAQLFPNAWTEPSVEALLDARRKVAKRIVELLHPGENDSGDDDGSGTTAGGTTAGTTPGTTTGSVSGSGSTSGSGSGSTSGSGWSDAGDSTTADTASSNTSAEAPPQVSTVALHRAAAPGGCMAGGPSDLATLLGGLAALAFRRRPRGRRDVYRPTGTARARASPARASVAPACPSTTTDAAAAPRRAAEAGSIPSARPRKSPAENASPAPVGSTSVAGTTPTRVRLPAWTSSHPARPCVSATSGTAATRRAARSSCPRRSSSPAQATSTRRSSELAGCHRDPSTVPSGLAARTQPWTPIPTRRAATTAVQATRSTSPSTGARCSRSGDRQLSGARPGWSAGATASTRCVRAPLSA